MWKIGNPFIFTRNSFLAQLLVNELNVTVKASSLSDKCQKALLSKKGKKGKKYIDI